MEHDQWLCLCYQNSDDGSKINDREVLKKYSVSVISDNIFGCLYSGTLFTSKRCIVLLHTLWAYNSLVVCYKFYSTDPRECLCTSWRYDEAYKNFSIDPAPYRKNPIKIKNKIVILNCQPLLLGENYTKLKAWQLKLA